jgi:DNA repair exonuclease SbcCD ATPase subunit
MNAIVTADWHIKSRQLAEFKQVPEDLFRIQDETHSDILVVLGDLTDDIGPLPHVVIDTLVSAIEELSSRFHTNVLLGNHDYGAHTADSTHTGSLLKSLGCSVYDRPAVHNGVLWLPYQHDIACAKKALAPHNTQAQMVFFHQGIVSARLNMLRDSPHGLDVEDFAPYDLAIGGDYHHQQNLPGTNIWYAGSPYFNNWGEANQNKGYLHLQDMVVTPYSSSCQLWINLGWPDVPEVIPPGSKVKVELATPDAPVPAELQDLDVHVVVTPPAHTLRTDADTASAASAAYWAALAAPDPSAVPDAQTRVEALVGQFAGAGNPILHIRRVVAENILSYGKLDFTFSPGLHVVSAPNGAGKSSLMQMVPVALFGSTTSEQKGPSLARYGSKGPAYVELEAESGKSLVVRRNRRPNTKSSVHFDGQQLQEGSTPNAVMTTLTGFTLDTLAASLFIDQREVNALLAGKPAEQRNLLSALCGLEAYRQAKISASAELTEAQTKLRGLEREQVIAASALQQVQAKIQTAQMLNAASAKNTQDAQKAGAAKEKQLTQKLTTHQTKVSAAQSKLTETKADLAHLTKVITDLATQRKALGAPLEVPPPKSVCTECEQPTPPKKLAALLKQWKEGEAARREHRLQYSQLENAHAQHQQAWAKLDRERETQNAEVFALQREEKLLATALAEHQREMSRLPSAKTVPVPDAKPAELALHAIHQGMEAATFEIAIQTLTVNAVSPKGIPSYLIQSLIPRLNQAVTYIASTLKPAVAVEFFAEDDALKVRVSKTGGGQSLAEVSNGEKQLASVLVTLALRSLVTSNVLFLDEPEIGLDEQNCHRMADLINSLKGWYECIVLIAHNPKLLDGIAADYRHTVVCGENGSHIELA